MGFELRRLNSLKVGNLKKRGRYGDGGGLWLQVSESGAKSWLFRFKRSGRARQMGLGSVNTISLAEARQQALECRRLLLQGKDPIDERDAAAVAAQTAAARGVTFEECAKRYIAAHADTWKHPKHRQQWPNTLSTYAYPIFGQVSVDSVDVGMVLRAVEPIWGTKPETASRVRMRIEAVLNWATARGYRTGDNPARWRGYLDKLLPARRKVKRPKHHPALPYNSVGEFMAELGEHTGTAARALEFLILNASRTSEVIAARWTEFDLKAGLWTIPGERMKAGREHRVPLSKRALQILGAMPREGEYVFPGDTKGRPISNMAMLTQLRRMNHRDITVHGFRSTFRDWAAEHTNYARDVAEMALAHVVDDKTEAAYRRGDLFEKRRRMAEDWAAFCARRSVGEVNVISLQGISPRG